MEFKLIIKKINNNLSREEEIVFNKWYKESEKHRSYFNRVQNYDSNSIDFIDVEKGWNNLVSKIDVKVIDAPKKRTLWSYVAAAIIVMLLTTPFVFNRINKGDDSEKVSSVEPGRDKAVLTLEDGKQIVLEKGNDYITKEVNSNGENIIYNTNNQDSRIAYNYLTIPKGGQFFVQLSDGTKVWLNSESKLKYPTNFIKGKPRKVELLYGEAYFDVSPSSNHKGSTFTVNTREQDVQVLGTEFNIKAYNGEKDVITTLVEGRVNVTNSIITKKLMPGFQSRMNADNSISISKVDVAYEVAWKNGYFMFDKESLEDMMTTLSRWYNIDVVFENKSKRKLVFSGLLNRANDIEELLMNFEKTGEIEFEIEKNTITIK